MIAAFSGDKEHNHALDSKYELISCLCTRSLFWNEMHPDVEKVKEAFFSTEDSLSTREDETDDGPADLYFEVLRILGMTCSCYSLKKRPNRVPLRYDILDPPQFFGDENVCCSGWLLRCINDAEAKEAGEYFAKCEQSLASLGIPVKLEISHQAIEENVQLSAQGYADLLVAAASNDLVRAYKLFEALNAYIGDVRVSRRKAANVRKLIRQKIVG
jgi:hypothetical protein